MIQIHKTYLFPATIKFKLLSNNNSFESIKNFYLLKNNI